MQIATAAHPGSSQDLCEAWALYNFGRLCLMRIRRQIRNLPQQQRVESTHGREVPVIREALTSLDDEQQQHLRIFRDAEHFLFRPLEVTVGIGVKFFVYTCAVKSLCLDVVTGPPSCNRELVTDLVDPW
eukprot:Skav208250  [mRNA]  locus=scaffold3005:46582:47404:- [translate_table: standard]